MLDRSLHGPIVRIVLAVACLALAGCAGDPPRPMANRVPAEGFCDLSDGALRPYVISVHVLSRTSASGVATIINGRPYVVTNRHNLPEQPVFEQVVLKNHKFQQTVATGMVAAGRDYAELRGLGYAQDYAVLTVRDPAIFEALPLFPGRYAGPVVAPSLAARKYEVGRGEQWFEDDLFDRLDFFLDVGASGAPIISCRGEVVGLYTALILEKDWAVAGFRGLSTPITRVWDGLGQ